MPRTSRELVDAALRDPEAFSAIIDRHKGTVYGLAYNFFQNGTTAEDVAQDVYLELFRNLDRIETDLHLGFWLRQTTTRKCIDYTRRQKHRRYEPLDNVVEPGKEARHRDPLLAGLLMKRVLQLPERMRVVILLRFHQDLKLAEIAEILEMPVNTVKTTLRRGLARLRDKIAAEPVGIHDGTSRI